MKGFVHFIRTQGVVGLAVGFILGGAISKVVSSMVSDIVNPLLGLVMGSVKGIESVVVDVAGARVLIGHFVSVFLDFVVIALVVYVFVHMLRLDRLDKKKKA